jgi:hypothetical protein
MALGVLCAVLDHDGQQISATQTRNQALADADHLALLHAIWTAESDLIPNETAVTGGIRASMGVRNAGRRAEPPPVRVAGQAA